MLSSGIRSVPERWWSITALCVLLLGGAGIVSQAQTEVPDNEAILQEELRDPFWPVGFYPEGWRVDESELPAMEEKAQVNAWHEAQQLLEVRGVSRMGSSGFYAVINGSTVTSGDLVAVEYENQVYRWRVAKITSKGVQLERVD